MTLPRASMSPVRQCWVPSREVSADVGRPVFRDVMGHSDQHLVGAVEHRLGRRDGSAALTTNCEEQGAESWDQDPSHTAPAFMRSCRCTIPTTFLSPSSTGSAMMPWRSMRLTAALA